ESKPPDKRTMALFLMMFLLHVVLIPALFAWVNRLYHAFPGIVDSLFDKLHSIPYLREERHGRIGAALRALSSTPQSRQGARAHCPQAGGHPKPALGR